MTVQILGIILGIFFLSLIYLLHKLTIQSARLELLREVVNNQAVMSTSYYLTLSNMLIDRDLLTEEDFKEFSEHGKLAPKNPTSNVNTTTNTSPSL